MPADLDPTGNESLPAGPKTRGDFWGALLVVHAVMMVAATAIVWWRGVAPAGLFAAPQSMAVQGAAGGVLAVLLLGVLAGGEWLLFGRSPSTDHLLGNPAVRQLTAWDSLLIGVLTGVVTEFAWRGALQPWAGLIATTLAHGLLYVLFSPNPTGRVVMVVCGTVLAAVCGLMAIHVGLFGAIALRAVYEGGGAEIVRRRAVHSALSPPGAGAPR